jgi:hypothetical protein
VSGRPELADRVAAALVEHGPSPGSALARIVRVRRASVMDVLHTDPRFVQVGRRRRSVWWLADEPGDSGKPLGSNYGVSAPARASLTGMERVSAPRTYGGRRTRLEKPSEERLALEAHVDVLVARALRGRVGDLGRVGAHGGAAGRSSGRPPLLRLQPPVVTVDYESR